MSKLPKQPLTSHPSVKAYLDDAFDYKEESVVVSGKLITRYALPGRSGTVPPIVLLNLLSTNDHTHTHKHTQIHSRGPGTAFPFAFEIVRQLCGDAKVKEVQDPMVFPPAPTTNTA